MPSVEQRKKLYLTFSNSQPADFPDYLGMAKLGGMRCCYLHNGEPYRYADSQRFEFEMGTLTLPAGISLVNDDRTTSPPLAEPLVLPYLIDLKPEGEKPTIPNPAWHYCEPPEGGGDRGTIACAKPVLKPNRTQVVLFIDDSQSGVIQDEPGHVIDPTMQYYFLQLLLPNQSVCYYMITATEEEAGNLIEAWNTALAARLEDPDETAFFVAVNGDFHFIDALQITYTRAAQI